MCDRGTRLGPSWFAACVAHELRTPIALQRALAEAALADPHASTAVLRAMGEDVVACCDQQQRLIDALFHLTQSQVGLPRQEPIDLAAMTSQLLRAQDLSRLESVVSLEPARTTGDPDLVERLAANLISNATRYNIIPGRIEVATRTEGEHALLCIANTGPRIPAAELTRLFQPFQRLTSRSRAGADGVGLGLAIVQAVADAHDATITARAPTNGGLRIEARFPANELGRSPSVSLPERSRAPIAPRDRAVVASAYRSGQLPTV